MTGVTKLRKSVSLYAVVTFFALFSAMPFFWMLITSFKRAHDLFTVTNNPFLYNDPPTLEHLHGLFYNTLFVKYLTNTLLIGVAVVVITVIIAVPAAYSLARWAGRWGENMGIGIFLTYLVPPTLLFIPLSKVISILGLHESLWSLILIYPTFTIPFCTWLLIGFFKSIPRDIEEQALIDGYSRIGAMVRIVLPLSVSGLLTVVVFAFTLSMHEFIYALAFISSSSMKTVSIGVPTELIGEFFEWGPLMAGASPLGPSNNTR
jgi:multiple sugar transport system permease protein